MPVDPSSEALENLSNETRRFAPPAELAAHANATSTAYDEARAHRLAFWAKQSERITWEEPWDRVLDWDNPPFAEWFVGGKLNASYNCVDRHVEAGLGDKVAIHWVGEPEGDRRDITYAELKDDVCRAANALSALGIEAGDRIAIYLPMIPEAVVAMLACARIGAPHTVVFGGFSADALASRIDDCQAKLVITSDGGYRRGSASALKPAVDEALTKTSTVEHVLVVRRTGQEVAWNDAVDLWWHDVVDTASNFHLPEAFDAEHPLYVMYTSGTTGKPKGILHTTGGYLVGTSYTHWAVFDLKPDSDVYWCTADIGWVTGHSYIVYGPLANGVTQVIYEGTPDSPHKGRWWEIIEKFGVTILYTAPTAIRTFMKWGREFPDAWDKSTLRILGSVGEPINPEAYIWYRDVIGGNRTPVVDTWWQTETGMIMISPLPGVTHGKPGSAMTAIPGVVADVVNDKGESVPNGSGGYLVLTEPWPAMLRTIWGDPDRFKETYWATYADKGYYFAGDGAKKDADGDIWLLGRVDDVMNVSGHRLSTTEIESALVSHPAVAEAAVVGASDETTGQAVCAYVILTEEAAAQVGPELVTDLRNHVAKEIGAIAKPRQIMIVPDLPKTRSGKIMRRLLRDIAESREVGDVTTLADSSVMDLIRSGATSGDDDAASPTASAGAGSSDSGSSEAGSSDSGSAATATAAGVGLGAVAGAGATAAERRRPGRRAKREPAPIPAEPAPFAAEPAPFAAEPAPIPAEPAADEEPTAPVETVPAPAPTAPQPKPVAESPVTEPAPPAAPALGAPMSDLEPTPEPTIGQLVASVSRDVSTLVHSEIQLAKAELSVSVKAGGIGAALVVVAGILAFLSVIMLSVAGAHFISMGGLDLAWSYLIVFGGYLLIALLLIVVALTRFKKIRGPKRAIAQAKATQAAFKR